MSNPFNFMNRRGFLKASFLAALASTPIGKAVAAVPVTSKVVGDVSSNSFTLAITASTTVRAYIEYGYGKSTILGKTPFVWYFQLNPFTNVPTICCKIVTSGIYTICISSRVKCRPSGITIIVER